MSFSCYDIVYHNNVGQGPATTMGSRLDTKTNADFVPGPGSYNIPVSIEVDVPVNDAMFSPSMCEVSLSLTTTMYSSPLFI